MVMPITEIAARMKKHIRIITCGVSVVCGGGFWLDCIIIGGEFRIGV